MKLFRRRPALPSASRPPLEDSERVVAWCPVGESADAVVVATNHGLWLPAAEKRLGWHEIHKVAWSGRELRIIPAVVAGVRDDYTVLEDGPAVTYLLLEPGEVPDQVRTRVTKSVAYTNHHPLPEGAVRVVGRRVSGRNGLTWAVRYDAGTPVERDEVVSATDELVGAARNSVAPPA
ncbi:hypothetical protein [Actinoplanes sp. NPDC023714]|uniref:hypothetical protein n=1 Tax=Actinoplanes sp. NPDC023714 TaxID=3154322 RepID=UPI0033D2AA73